MNEFEVMCPFCGRAMRVNQADLAKVLPCPACGNELRFEVEDGVEQQAAVTPDPPAQSPQVNLPLGTYPLAGASTTPVAPPAMPAWRQSPILPLPGLPQSPQPPVLPRVTPPTQRPTGALPERMKANRLIAGKICAGCGNTMELGQDVFNCQNCGGSLHAACREQMRGCANEQCVSYYAAVVPPPIPASQRAERGGCPPDSVPCRFCGEFIKKTARKCRFCDEFQNEAERARVRGKNSDGDALSGAEIAFGLLCCGVSLIAGLIFGLMGKKKGWTIMLLGIVSTIVWFIVAGIIGSLNR
jgi:hypothetical protein